MAAIHPKRWTREEYYRLAEQEFFSGQRVELLGGQVIVMPPQSFFHYSSSDIVSELFREIFSAGYWVRQQAPLSLPNASELEPDISVVVGSRKDYTDHPTAAVIVVEVAKSSLEYDTKTKPGVYASGGIPEYWVLDLVNRQLIVHRQPAANAKDPFGHSYQQVQTVAEGGSVSFLEKPAVVIPISQLLPPANS